MPRYKMVTAIVSDQDANGLLKALVNREYGATKIASTGGLLRHGNAIIMVGVEEEKVEDIIGIVRGCCQSRRQASPGLVAALPFMPADRAAKVEVGGAVVLVTDVERYHRV